MEIANTAPPIQPRCSYIILCAHEKATTIALSYPPAFEAWISDTVFDINMIKTFET